MIPVCRPTLASGEWIIYEVSPTGKTKWVDYIPVKRVVYTATPDGTHQQAGLIPVRTLQSVTGLTAWEDYTPVDFVADSGTWEVTSTGFIPVSEVVVVESATLIIAPANITATVP